jgi:hypothetical protein
MVKTAATVAEPAAVADELRQAECSPPNWGYEKIGFANICLTAVFLLGCLFAGRREEQARVAFIVVIRLFDGIAANRN